MKVTVVSPTFNEAENMPRLIEAIGSGLRGRDYEILIVDDDSPDGTWQVADRISRYDSRVRVLRRLTNRGLGFSVIDGFAAANGEAVACIDADLQHDPAILSKMLETLQRGEDLVVGCRYMPDGGVGDWSLPRRFESLLATKLAQWLLGIKLRDPMSGYFMMWRNDFVHIRDNLNGAGFKILLEIVVALGARRVAEVPYTFRCRTAGVSKLSTNVVLLYLRQLLRLRAVKGRTHERPEVAASASSKAA